LWARYGGGAHFLLDVLRGAALLGIALMNIVFSGWPMAADFNPKVSGGATGPVYACGLAGGDGFFRFVHDGLGRVDVPAEGGSGRKTKRAAVLERWLGVLETAL
jgi:hypothetical protein